MAKIEFKLPRLKLKSWLGKNIDYLVLCIMSLMYNSHLSQSYVADILIEPIFKIVDSKIFSRFLGENFKIFAELTNLIQSFISGPFFIVAVACLTTAVVFISYWIGLPYWWNKVRNDFYPEMPKLTILYLFYKI